MTTHDALLPAVVLQRKAVREYRAKLDDLRRNYALRVTERVQWWAGPW